MFIKRTRAVLAAVMATATLGAVAGPARGQQLNEQWHRSTGTIPISVDQAILVKVDAHRIMWIGGTDEQAADGRRAFLYDVRTQQFRETAPVPAAKVGTSFAIVGALADGSVVVTGGLISDDPTRTAANRLSYRYLPGRNVWVRTGNLPEPQMLIGTSTALLSDGRLLAGGGMGQDYLTTNTGSRRAFLFDPDARAMVDEIDPATGLSTGRRVSVRGAWDYTRNARGAVTEASEGHVFGDLVRMADGRALLVGGHVSWSVFVHEDTTVLSTRTDFFDPRTGRWTQGPALPPVAGEDDLTPNSHGGRANGACVAAMPDNTVVIAGGNTASDGEAYNNGVGRQSIVILIPARNGQASHFTLVPRGIPSGEPYGGLFGSPGRNHLPCYVLARGRVLFAGGQSDFGEDLYDTYVFDPQTYSLQRGPDLLHGTAVWAGQHPDYGYPADYVTSLISTREVSMHSSLLVFDGRTVVHGGAFNGVDYDQLGVPFVEQLTLR